MTGSDITEVDTILTKSGPDRSFNWNRFWHEAIIKTGRTVVDVDSPGRIMAGVGALAFFFGVAVFPGGPAGIIVPIVALAGAWAFFNFEQSKRRRTMDHQLPMMLSSLRTQMSAGMTIQGAMMAIADDLPSPLGDEMRQVKADVNVSIPLEEALDHLAARLKSRVMFFLVSSIGIAIRSGSDLVPQLITIEEIVRQRARIEGKIRAALALAKPTSYLAIAAPPLMAIYQFSTDPKVSAYFFGEGIFTLFVAIGMYAGGIFVIQTMVKNVEKI
jgi:tight adherence protein B